MTKYFLLIFLLVSSLSHAVSDAELDCQDTCQKQESSVDYVYNEYGPEKCRCLIDQNDLDESYYKNTPNVELQENQDFIDGTDQYYQDYEDVRDTNFRFITVDEKK